MSYCKIKTTNFNNLNSLLKGHTMERKILVTALLAGTTLLVACDDIAKGVAREILKDEVAPAQTVQEPQVQDLQPIIPNGQQPVQQYNQYGQPIANQQQMPMQPQVQDLQPVIPNSQQPVQQYNQYGQPTTNQQQMPQIQNQTAMAQAAPLPPPEPAPKVRERVVRKRAYVLTQHGSNVMVRSEPNLNARKVGYLYDGEDAWVIGETTNCQTINNLYGCWVKVKDSNGLTGYSFDAYLQY